VTSDNPNAALIELCQRMLTNRQEWDALTDRDEYAEEECSPNYSDCQALNAEYVALEVALTRTARPVTPEGIRLLAEVAVQSFADRSADESIEAPESFAAWLALFALTSAARMPEPIPLPSPRDLPLYWPVNDVT
jgi:hypothetical protein